MSNYKETLRKVLTNRNSFVTTLLTVLLDVWGTEALEWTPETIKMELEDDFGIKLPPVILDRIMAGIIILTTDEFYQSLPDFIELTNVLNGHASTMGTI
jgi:hypothetical protein